MAADEENPAPETARTAQTDEPEKFTTKKSLMAVGVLITILIIAAVLARTLGNTEDESNAEGPPSNLPEVEGQKPKPDYSNWYFNRIATVPVCLQLDENCNVDTETATEILYSTEDGNTVVYTDAMTGNVGFIDITDPASPVADGVVEVGGEPTSVIVKGKYAVVSVNTSPDFVNTAGNLQVIDIEARSVVRVMELGGQPDATALSPDHTFIAVAIENERDEDLNGGALPQLPAGFLVVVDSSSEDPMDWTMENVGLTDLDGVLYASDPEPEYLEINEDNVVTITLQENNAIVLVDLASLDIVKSFSAGTVDLEMIDIAENGVVELTGSLSAVPREPDAVSWIGSDYFATADEGDLDGGSRGFTIYDTEGNVIYTSGNEMDVMTIRYGHYPEERSENKGNEPETVRYAEYGSMKLLFVNSERSSLVFVYDVADVTAPVFRQVLPSGVGPEGVFAIPSRNLLVVAAEEDAREDKIRSSVVIYELQDTAPVYPTLVSVDREDGMPIPFSALSGLCFGDGMLYSVEDSFYKMSRIFTIDVTATPYTIVKDMRLLDTNDILLNSLNVNASAVMLNDDKTVNLDLEGIESVEGGFWVVSEGSGTVGDDLRPFVSPNLLAFINTEGVIQDVVSLPESVATNQVRFGFKGVAVDGDNVVVAFQRAWTGEDQPRLGIYNSVEKTWKFVFYPLDAPESQYGGWVGLSDLASLGDGGFLVLERDNQGGPDAAIKKIYQINLGDFSVAEGTIIEKAFVHDVLPDLKAPGGLVYEKVEGLAVDDAGNVWINNDNDGVDDNSGEQQLINLGNVL